MLGEYANHGCPMCCDTVKWGWHALMLFPLCSRCPTAPAAEVQRVRCSDILYGYHCLDGDPVTLTLRTGVSSPGDTVMDVRVGAERAMHPDDYFGNPCSPFNPSRPLGGPSSSQGRGAMHFFHLTRWTPVLPFQFQVTSTVQARGGGMCLMHRESPPSPSPIFFFFE